MLAGRVDFNFFEGAGAGGGGGGGGGGRGKGGVLGSGRRNINFKGIRVEVL